MSRCLCKDNTKIVWPFTLVDLFACDVKKVQGDISSQFMYFGTWRLYYLGPFMTRIEDKMTLPPQCKCKNSKKPRTLTGMGCAMGGFPRCPGGWELQCRGAIQ